MGDGHWGVQAEPRVSEHTFKLWGMWQNGDKMYTFLTPKGPEVDPEKAGPVQLAKLTDEGRGGGVVEPALASEGGTDEGCGEADVEEYLDEEVVVVKHLRNGSRHQHRGV